MFEGSEISVHFDPMISKIIAYGPDRESARKRLIAALRESVYLGIPTNVPFLLRVLESEEFVGGTLSTDFLDLHPELAAGPDDGTSPPDAAYVGAALCRSLGTGSASAAASGSDDVDAAALWDTMSGFRVWEKQS